MLWSGLLTDSLCHRLIIAHPDSDGDEFDGGEEVAGVLFISGGDGSVVFDLVEEALDVVPVAIQEGAESRHVDTVGHRFDVGPGAPLGEAEAECVAFVGPVGEQDLTASDGPHHVLRALAVVGLALRELQHDRHAIGVHEGVDLGRQSASRAPHALGSSVVPSGGRRAVRTPFFTFPPC